MPELIAVSIVLGVLLAGALIVIACLVHRRKSKLEELPLIIETPVEPQTDLATELVFNLSQLILGPVVAFGSHSKIYSGYYCGADVAIKEFVSTTDATQDKDNFLMEIESLKQLRHPHVVDFYGATVLELPPPPRYIIITELASCSLRDFLDNVDGLKTKQALRLTEEIAKGCAYLHSMKIVHFDIKPANLLLDASGKLKICDFGISKVCGGDDTPTAFRGTPMYMAPEVLRGQVSLMSFAVDVYSWAMVSYELFHLKLPLPTNWSLEKFVNQVVSHGYRPKLGPLIAARIRKLLIRAWDTDPHARPMFEPILVELAWFVQELQAPDKVFTSGHLVEVFANGTFIPGRVTRNNQDGTYDVVFDSTGGSMETFAAVDVLARDNTGQSVDMDTVDRKVMFKVVEESSYTRNPGIFIGETFFNILSPRAATLESPSTPESSADDIDRTLRGRLMFQQEDYIPMSSSPQVAKADLTRKDVVYLNEIGRGASGRVFRSLRLGTLELVAIKSVKVYNKCNLGLLLKEIAAFDLPHSQNHILDLKGAFYVPEDRAVNLVLELMDGGSCEDLMKTKGRFDAQDEYLLAALATGILRGLDALHSSRRIHRDIKPANVLIDRTKGAKISDFGIARELMAKSSESSDVDMLADTFVGTISYMSPERLAGSKYSYSSDVWALGITLISVANGTNPFGTMSFFELLEHLKGLDSSPALLSDFSSDFKNFIEHCLKFKHEERASVSELLSHSWISKYHHLVVDNVFHDMIERVCEISRYNRDDLKSIVASMHEHLSSVIASSGLNTRSHSLQHADFYMSVTNLKRLSAQLGVEEQFLATIFQEYHNN